MAACPSAQFGSPSSAQRATPNVMFIIDTGACLSGDELQDERSRAAVETTVKSTVLRILLYFFIHVDVRFTWSYQLLAFDSASTFQASQSVSRHLQDFDLAALEEFAQELRQALGMSNSAASERTSSTPPIKRLSAVLKKAASTFQWSWCSRSGVMPSPARVSQQLSAPVKLRNYLYIISPAPQTIQQLLRYTGVAGAGAADDLKANASVLLPSLKEPLATSLAVCRKELLGAGLWNLFIEKRASISWVALPLPTPSESLSERCTEQSFAIETGISTILAAYGGAMIRSGPLLAISAPVPFALYFRTFRKKVLDPKLGVALLAATDKLSAEARSVLAAQTNVSTRELWRGRLTAAGEEEETGIQIALRAAVTSAAGQKKHSADDVYSRSSELPVFSVSIPTMTVVRQITTEILKDSMMERHVFTCAARGHASEATAFDETLSSLRSAKKTLVAWVHVDAPAHSLAPASPACETYPLDAENPFADDDKVSVSTVKRLAVLFSLRSGMALMRLVHKEHESFILDELTDEAQEGSEEDGWHSEFLDQWFSNNLADDIAGVIFGGRASSEARSRLPEATFYVWDPDIDGERLHGESVRRNASEPSPKPSSPQVAKAAPRTPRRSSRSSVTCSSIADLTALFRHEYIETLYRSQHTPQSFVKNFVPSFWDVVDSMACGEVGAPSPSRRKFRKAKMRLSENLLESLCNGILLSVSQLEQKYRSILDLLDEPPDPQLAAPAPGLLDHVECAALKSWWKDIYDNIPVGQLADPRRILRQEVNKLRLLDTKLQMIMLLECLRSNCEVDALLPDIAKWFSTTPPISPAKETKRKRKCKSVIDDFIARPSKKRKADEKRLPLPTTEDPDPPVFDANSHDNKALFIRAVEELMDRICISTVIAVVGSANSSGVYKDFVEPVVVKYYNFYVPDLVKSLVLKAGGDPSVQEAVPPSPFFKKKKIRGSGRGGVTKRDSSSRGPSASKHKAKTEPTALPRRVSDFLKGLGKRQMVVGKPKSKAGKASGLKRHDTSTSTGSLGSHSTEAENLLSAGIASLPAFGNRVSTASVGPFKNQNVAALRRDSVNLQAPPLKRTASLPAISNDRDNPFWEGPPHLTREVSDPSELLGPGKRSSMSLFPALKPVPPATLNPVPARPFAQFARIKPPSDLITTSPLKSALRRPIPMPPPEQLSSPLPVTPKKRSGRRASLVDYERLDNEVHPPGTPTAQRRTGVNIALDDNAENSILDADTPLSHRLAKVTVPASPGTPTRSRFPLNVKCQSSPTEVRAPSELRSPARPAAPLTPTKPPLLQRIQSARSSLSIKSPYNASLRKSTPKKRSRTTPRKQSRASLPPCWPAPASPTRPSGPPPSTPSKVRFTASPPALKLNPATPPPRPGKRGGGGVDAIAATPLATPGSCKRLQSMLEGFADSDWDEMD
ncbi:hypothetical protein BDZ88DRAFT_173556 [Geranomyces variabilis]|nr:hypothetical protein BDZ88DRAFT_173556 [Geranomyces variabilis]KAJ3139051.1 hypothetical protein HDU90_000957 [Geranomyces variabilis]